MYNDDENEYRYVKSDIVQDNAEVNEGAEAGQNADTQQKTNYYTPYDEIEKDAKTAKKEARRAKRERRKLKIHKPAGFGMKLAKTTAIALVFGLVASLAFTGTNYFTSDILGINNDVAATTTTDSSDTATVSTTSEVTTTSSDSSDVSAVVDSVMPSIVAVSCIYDVNYYGMSEEATSAGSGIIVAQTDDYLYIVTNNHVVEDSSSISVTFIDDTEVSAEIKGTDSSSDIAVLSINMSDLSSDTLSQIKVATLGDSDSLEVGQTAIAIGNALGYGQSVTTGVISALNREVTIDNVTNELIQTDAAINPGNSGGALLNTSGEVIGINSAKYSDTDVEGMGYSIPISTAEPIINELIEREAVDEADSAYLGVAGVDVTSEVAESYNMPTGVYVSKVVSGSAAETAGIQQGDVITSFDGKTISSMEDLQSLLEYYSAGTTVDVVIQRADGGSYQEQTISVTLGKKSS